MQKQASESFSLSDAGERRTRARFLRRSAKFCIPRRTHLKICFLFFAFYFYKKDLLGDRSFRKMPRQRRLGGVLDMEGWNSMRAAIKSRSAINCISGFPEING